MDQFEKHKDFMKAQREKAEDAFEAMRSEVRSLDEQYTLLKKETKKLSRDQKEFNLEKVNELSGKMAAYQVSFEIWVGEIIALENFFQKTELYEDISRSRKSSKEDKED